jgi:thiamine-phosphate diphosphorylase/hydroxyethylthiazole kinase
VHGSRSPNYKHSLDGIAVISDIVSSTHPEEAARQLSRAFREGKAETNTGRQAVFAATSKKRSKEDLLEGVVGLMKVVKEKKPLAHQASRTSLPLVGSVPS